MNKLFAEWYKIADPNPSPEKVLAREKVCDAQATKIDTEMIVRLVSFFLAKGPNDVVFPQEMSVIFQEGDPTFPMKDNLLELRVLSGAMLSGVIESAKPPKALIASMALDCGAFGVKRVLIPDILEIGRSYIDREAIAAREIGNHSITSIPLFKANEAFADASQWGAHLKDFSKIVSAAVNRLEQAMQVSAEETNILWWILNGRSKRGVTPYHEIDSTKLCLLLAKDLADLTIIVPGPASAKATLAHMLDRAKGKGGKGIQLFNSVNNVSQKVREEWSQQLSLMSANQITPIALALKKSLEVDNNTGWLSVYEKASTVSPRMRYTSLQLSEQLYNEILFIRFLQDKPKK